MEEVIPTNSIFDGSGTNNLPLNCGWINGKHNTRRKNTYTKLETVITRALFCEKVKSFGPSDVGAGEVAALGKLK